MRWKNGVPSWQFSVGNQASVSKGRWWFSQETWRCTCAKMITKLVISRWILWFMIDGASQWIYKPASITGDTTVCKFKIETQRINYCQVQVTVWAMNSWKISMSKIYNQVQTCENMKWKVQPLQNIVETGVSPSRMFSVHVPWSLSNPTGSPSDPTDRGSKFLCDRPGTPQVRRFLTCCEKWVSWYTSVPCSMLGVLTFRNTTILSFCPANECSKEHTYPQIC